MVHGDVQKEFALLLNILNIKYTNCEAVKSNAVDND